MLQVAINIPGSMARLLFLKTAERLPKDRPRCRIIGAAAGLSALLPKYRHLLAFQIP
jgi:hypothetical protein